MQKNFQIECHKKILRGVIHKPDSESNKYPLLVIAHGFTGSRTDAGLIHVRIARSLEQIGYAVIRFDFSGSGESDGRFEEMTYLNELSELSSVIEYAKSVDFIDNSRISLMGFSMGGALSISYVSENNGIDRLILLAPAGNMYDLIIREVLNDKVQRFMDNGSLEFGAYKTSREFYDQIAELDVYEKARNIKNKTLIIHGTNDQAVYPLIGLRIKNIIGDNCDIQFVDGADHCFSSIEYQNKVISGITEFLK